MISDGTATEGQMPADIMGSLSQLCTIKSILFGTRDMLPYMTKYVEEQSIQIVIDDAVFEIEDTKSAYERIKSQKHFPKVIIKID